MIISRAINLLVLPVQTAINAVYDRVRKLTGFLSFSSNKTNLALPQESLIV